METSRGDAAAPRRLSGCDLKVRPGDKNTITTKTWLARWITPQYSYTAGSSKVWRVAVDNARGCHNAPGMVCRRVCRVKVTVKTPPSRLLVRQGGGSDARQRVSIKNVALDRVDVSGEFDVSVSNAALAGDVRLISSRGDVRVADTDCGDDGGGCWLKASTGSVYYRETRDVLHTLSATTRRADMSPMNRGAAAAATWIVL